MLGPAAAQHSPRGYRGLAVAGLLLVLAGVIGYFAIVTHAVWLPSVRNNAAPNWILIALGVGLSVLAMRRAPGFWMPRVVLGVNLVLAGLFAAMIYVMFEVPAATGPAIGAPAPDFALLDQSGKTVQLAALRGAPVLLVFYRGHW